VSERLLISRLRTSIWNISIIQCYAPREGTAEEQKEKCYSQLNEVLREKTRKRDIVIIMGCVNVKLCAVNDGIDHLMKT
jgi:exonuclease III